MVNTMVNRTSCSHLDWVRSIRPCLRLQVLLIQLRATEEKNQTKEITKKPEKTVKAPQIPQLRRVCYAELLQARGIVGLRVKTPIRGSTCASSRFGGGSAKKALPKWKGPPYFGGRPNRRTRAGKAHQSNQNQLCIPWESKTIKRMVFRGPERELPLLRPVKI